MSKKNEIVDQVITEESLEEVLEEKESETIISVEPLIGTVTNCKRLNVRKKPSLKSKAVDVLDAGNQVEVDVNKSTKDFYSVIVHKNPDGTPFTGYCMKEYITI